MNNGNAKADDTLRLCENDNGCIKCVNSRAQWGTRRQLGLVKMEIVWRVSGECSGQSSRAYTMCEL